MSYRFATFKEKYRVDANKSDDENCGDWRSELYSDSLEKCREKVKQLEATGQYSEIMILENATQHRVT